MARRRNLPILRNGISLETTPLDTADQVTDWFAVGNLQNVTLQAWGITAGDILQVEGTSDPEAMTPGHVVPADQIVKIGADITADGFYRVEKGPDVLRLKLSSDAGSGAGAATTEARHMGDLLVQ